MAIELPLSNFWIKFLFFESDFNAAKSSNFRVINFLFFKSDFNAANSPEI